MSIKIRADGGTKLRKSNEFPENVNRFSLEELSLMYLHRTYRERELKAVEILDRSSGWIFRNNNNNNKII